MGKFYYDKLILTNGYDRHAKTVQCKKYNIDIMIDDDWRIIKNLADNKVRTLYFRDTNLKKLQESEYIKEVNNWGDIYRFICEIM